ncbi:MAG: hypothetical protein ACTSRZ_08645 [Promethearchaeota archaeon]
MLNMKIFNNTYKNKNKTMLKIILETFLLIFIIAIPTLVINKVILEENKPLILYNQVGYLPNESKIFFIDLKDR